MPTMTEPPEAGDRPAGRIATGAPSPAVGPGGSPTRQFALLSLLTIGASTVLLGFALTYFVERGLLDREWSSTAAFVRSAARVTLRSSDLAPGTPVDEAADRFEEFTRQVRMLPEVIRLVAYDSRGQPLWSDTERSPRSHPMHGSLRQALAGETAVRLEPGRPEGQERVELYVPLTFSGEGRIAGVVEAYVDASRVLASARRARLGLWALALGSAGVLYLALYGVVWRASRTLRAQHAALAQRADELARANGELRAVQRQLLAAERFAAFGEITAAVAHGLANPLATIRATAQVTLLDAPEGPVRERLLQVVAETDRLSHRMRALLDLGRPIESRRVPTALDAAIRHALEPVRARSAAQRIRLEVSVPAELPKVRLDPARFEEALLCLAGNALDAMPDGGSLRVAGRLASIPGGGAAGGEIELLLEDSGPGIPPAVLARAFEPFFTTKPQGTGLGLAVARKLLADAGGRLVLETGPGGTRAVITLPVEES